MHITLGQDYYHLVNQINDWCTDQFGKGEWVCSSKEPNWTIPENWTIHQIFGFTTYAFKNEKDYMLFLLKWDKGDNSEYPDL